MTVEEYINKLSLEEKCALLQGNSSWTTQPIPRLLLPSIRLADGPHGLRKQAGSADHLGINQSIPATCFPTSATMANTWNPELGEELGRALGEEAQAYIRREKDKYFLDLKQINARLLERAGVERIDVSDACTACQHHRFWSHRVTGGLRGSQGAIIVCKGGEK